MNDNFKLGKLSITQNSSAMKIGTDALLLGAWAKIEGSKVLDIGTGTGVLSLMSAHRCKEIHITALEINKSASLEATQNVNHNGFENRIQVINENFNEMCTTFEDQFDTIISNPPYFSEHRHVRAKDMARTQARQTTGLSLQQLFFGVQKCLKQTGVFNMVFPFNFKQETLITATAHGLYCSDLVEIMHDDHKEPSIMLMSFRKASSKMKSNQLQLYKAGTFSKEYYKLMQDFLPN